MPTWKEVTEANPEHSHNFARKWKLLAAQGKDINGEARLIDAMVERNSTILDAGCGMGDRTTDAATTVGPHGKVVGVDVNELALLLATENAESLGVADRFAALLPDQVDPDLTFDEIWSNPPIRIGKEALHELLLTWLPRLTPGGRRLYALMAGMSTTLPDELRALLGELVSDIGERVYLPGQGGRTKHDISVIAAPVFDHHRRQVMVVSLQIGHALTDAEITKRARGLVATADALTAQLGGAKPGF